MELILKAKDIRVEFKGRTCLDIDELVSLTNSTQIEKRCVENFQVSVEFGLHKKTPCKTKKILQGVFLCSDIYVRPQGRLPCGVDFLCRDYLSLPWDFFLCFD